MLIVNRNDDANLEKQTTRMCSALKEVKSNLQLVVRSGTIFFYSYRKESERDKVVPMKGNNREWLLGMANVFYWSIQWDVIRDESIEAIFSIESLKLWTLTFAGTWLNSGTLLSDTCPSNRSSSDLEEQKGQTTCASFFASHGLVVMPVNFFQFFPINLDDLFTNRSGRSWNRLSRRNDILHYFFLSFFRWWIRQSIAIISGSIRASIDPINKDKNRDQRDEGETFSTKSNRHFTPDAVGGSISYLEDNLQMVSRCDLFQKSTIESFFLDRIISFLLPEWYDSQIPFSQGWISPVWQGCSPEARTLHLEMDRPSSHASSSPDHPTMNEQN